MSVGQSRANKTIDASNCEKIVVDGTNISKIDLQTSGENMIKIYWRSDGEYKNKIICTVKAEESVVYINSIIDEISRKFNDKLSAHKVLAASLILEVPKNLKLEIRSDISNVSVEGSFSSFLCELKSGAVDFSGTSKIGIINTNAGSIVITTLNASVDAISRNGILKISKTLTGSDNWVLRSINGDITVLASE